MVRRIWQNGAEGGTPLTAEALNSLEDDVEESLNLSTSFRLNVGAVTTGVAGASLGPKLPDNSQDLNLSLPGLDTYGWVVACFLDNGEHGEKLSLFYSPNGKTVYGGLQNPVYWPDRLRDPSIIYWQGFFYVAYTLADGVGRNFRIIKSETGGVGTWSVVATVSVSALVATGDKCWAPELVIDGSDVYAFFTWQKSTTSETVAGSGNGVLSSMGWVKATNTTTLATWSAPTALNTSGFTTAYIDGVPIKMGADYYFFSSGGATIYRAKSTTGITGLYTQDRTGDWAGWGSGIEGPYLTQLPGGLYRIYFDRYVAGTGHWYSESSDLSTWSAPVQVASTHGTLPAGTRIRHGSFLQLPNMDSAAKIMASTMSPQGPSTASVSHGKVIPTAAVTAMDGAVVNSDPVGLLRGIDGAGNMYVVQGGTYMLTCDVAGTGMSATASRVFCEYNDGGSTRYARFSMGGVGEDTYTGSAIVNLATNARIRVQMFQNQGANRSIIVTTKLTRLGA